MGPQSQNGRSDNGRAGQASAEHVRAGHASAEHARAGQASAEHVRAGYASAEHVRADYARAGFARRLGWGRTPAVLLVDAVVAYTDPGSPLYCATGGAALTAMAAIAAAARGRGVPVVYTAVRYADPSCAEAPLFAAKVPALRAFVAGGPLAGFPPQVAPRPGEHVVVKHHASAFAGTALAAWLTSRAIDTLVIGGFSTSGCVRASAVDALQHGFRPMVVRDACADRAAGPHEANLFDLDAKYADVVGLGEAVDRLTGVGERARRWPARAW